jgi:hypothetical protein
MIRAPVAVFKEALLFSGNQNVRRGQLDKAQGLRILYKKTVFNP